jgi:phage gp46-like protein
VVTLVRAVKSMRELGCDSFSGEPDAEIAGRWLRTVEDIMEQIRVTEDLRVNCVTHLLSDKARSWWDIVRSRRPTGSWTWTEFRVQFESQFYS